MLKRDGWPRLIEAPKPRLKRIQRYLLDEILSAIPPAQEAHGFRPERSVASFVEPHAGRAIVIRFDLRNFFPSIRKARVLPIFLTAGYPEPVARLLAGLCTNRAPPEVLRDGESVLKVEQRRALKLLYGEPHLPQGAPSSPAIANLCAFRLDRRLAGLAASANARYTQYADDLLFSGGIELARAARGFEVAVSRIALEEGFEVQTRKTRVMRRGVAQRAGGLVLNEKPNVPRHEYDRLKAILHNCGRFGPETQNKKGIERFKEHLAGRVAYVASINPARGVKLRALFERIVW